MTTDCLGQWSRELADSSWNKVRAKVAPAPGFSRCFLGPRCHMHLGRRRGRQLCLGVPGLRAVPHSSRDQVFPECLVWWTMPLCVTGCDSEGRKKHVLLWESSLGDRAGVPSSGSYRCSPQPSPSHPSTGSLSPLSLPLRRSQME